MTAPKWAEAAKARDNLILRTLNQVPEWWDKRVQPRLVRVNGCLVWTGSTNGRGYGHIAIPMSVAVSERGTSLLVGVHRVALVRLLGRPLGLDEESGHYCHDAALKAGTCWAHACEHRRCVEHVEVQSRQQNLIAANVRCKRGHLLDETSIPLSNGSRRCGICTSDWHAAYYTAHKEHVAERNRGRASVVREAYTELGMTRREYVAQFGYSTRTALAISKALDEVAKDGVSLDVYIGGDRMTA